jgi:hypothetical protein
MSDNDIENKYGPMVRAAGYAGTRSMINDLNMWCNDESELVAMCQTRIDGEDDATR